MADEALVEARKHLWITYFNAQLAAQGRDVPPPDMLTALRDVEAAAVKVEVRALREALESVQSCNGPHGCLGCRDDIARMLASEPPE